MLTLIARTLDDDWELARDFMSNNPWTTWKVEKQINVYIFLN
jgi:hypothetical protein